VRPMHRCQPVDPGWFERAPVCHTVSRDMPVSARRLFAVFEDPQAWARWAPVLRSVEMVGSRPYGVDTIRLVTVVGGIRVLERFIVWDPDRRLTFFVEAAGVPLWHAFAEDFLIEDLGANRSRLIWRVAYASRKPLRFVDPLLKPLVVLLLGYTLRLLTAYAQQRG